MQPSSVSCPSRKRAIAARLVLLAALFAAAGVMAHAAPTPVTINFDNLATGVAVSTQYNPQVVFSTPTGYYRDTLYTRQFYRSYPNSIVSRYNACDPFTTCGPGDVYLHFPTAVKNFSFYVFGSVHPYHLFYADVYVSGVFYGTYEAFGNGQPSVPILFDKLKGLTNVTDVLIYFASNPDAVGRQYELYYDDFTFTPNFDVNITSGRVGGVLNSTTKSALLGADVALNASVTPSTLTGGTFSWSAAGPKQQVSASSTGSSYTLRWTETGTYQVKVTYSRNGFTATSFLNVNVVAPILDNHTAQQQPSTLSGGTVGMAGIYCDETIGQNSQFTLGCNRLYVPHYNESLGITLSSSVHIPSGQYLSDLSQSGVKYTQRVSAFRKQLNGGVVKCRTRRSSEGDNNSGWILDGDPTTETYDPRPTGVKYFSEGSSLTIETEDNPGEALEGGLIDGAPPTPPGINDARQHDAFWVDDYFQTYVVYFTKATSSIKRTLGKLSWNWGGEVVYDARSTHPFPFRLKRVWGDSGPRTGAASGEAIVYQGSTRDANFRMGTCPQSPTPVPYYVDNSRVFVRQQYTDILNRQPDAAWLVWVSIIADCSFDQGCINRTRISVVRGFYESSEFRQTHPGFENPGSPQYNENYVYQLYTTLLKRPPDANWSGWVNYINQTGDYDGLVGGFVNSAEYRNRVNSLWTP